MSIGIILQTMPSLVISQVMRHIIGIIMPIMPFIIGFIPIIGIIIGMPIIGFMPFIGIMFGIIGFMPIMGLMPPIIGIIEPIGIAFIIGIPMLALVVGIAFIMMTASYAPLRTGQDNDPISPTVNLRFLCFRGGVSVLHG